ncbi:ABC transporter ATP-binding protein [Halocynthiibacter sp. C4]|uniref:ABC transporter ATP-binding protein n=1 Tax=Halocynthiibacter sp. C4 TaxID=2992758 RepID=UPI00237BFCEB|nr:ABC transporter ATP-binding protein [Halocynthiibacter sp. C4]MDE0591043.1 ABC transporter ATP-binding protein [Halocynthiibacter sp. C4]
MLRLHNLHKTFRLNGRSVTVAKSINQTLPSGVSIGLLGNNGAGKSTLLKMIAGTETPTSGRIISTGSISYPVGFAGSFHPDLTGAQNARFVARVYGVDTYELEAFVEDFAELGDHFRLPFRTYSSGMRSRLAFGVSMAIPFDTYLVDEVTSVGDAAFQAKSKAVFKERMQKSGAIVVSHSMPMIKEMCEAGAVLQDGYFYFYAEIGKAIEHYSYTTKNQLPPWLRR